MTELETGSFAAQPFSCDRSASIRVVSWNINRGVRLAEVIAFLSKSEADLILLQETDVNARRTARRNIPREIAQSLGMNYVFGREFEELAQGSRAMPAYHGQVTLSRFLLSDAYILRFRSQSGFWRPRPYIPRLACLQRRMGSRMALVCEVLADRRKLIACNVHLESRGNSALRTAQLVETLDDVGRFAPKAPVLIAGDFNFNLASEPAASLARGRGFSNPFLDPGGTSGTTVRRLGRVACIDSMLTSGGVRGSKATIHDSVSASDHYPLSIQLRWS